MGILLDLGYDDDYKNQASECIYYSYVTFIIVEQAIRNLILWNWLQEE